MSKRVFIPVHVQDRIAHFIARHLLPKRLIYWAAIHLGAYATGGTYGSTVVGDLTMLDACGRWARDKGL